MFPERPENPTQPAQGDLVKHIRGVRLLAGIALATAAVVAAGVPAGAVSATASITGGSLAFVSSPSTAGFTATLTGADQTVNATQTFDIGDASGSGAGWNITATSTTFTTSSPVHTLSTSAVTSQA